MLESIRANAQSWGVKIAFGLIIIVFVFWGVGSFAPSGSSTIMKVNGVPINASDVEAEVKAQLGAMQAGNPSLDREGLERMVPWIKQQVMQDLLRKTLLTQEAERIGLTVTPQELLRAIAVEPVFHNEKGVFDPEVYERVLKAQGQMPGVFEGRVKESLLERKFQMLVTGAAYMPPSQAKNVFMVMNEQRVLEALVFKASEFFDEAKPTDETVLAHYEANAYSFQIAPQANVRFVAVSAQTIAKNETASDAELTEYYEKNQSAFTHPEQVHARHILILADKGADAATDGAAKKAIDEAAATIQGGKSFAEVASAVSQDGSARDGGDLGWFERGRMVPEFEEAAFGLAVGQVSKPVRTPFGWHLIKLEAHKAAGVTPLAEAKTSIENTVRLDKAQPKVQELLDNLLVAVINGQDLAGSAAKSGLAVEESGLKTAAELQQTLRLKQAEIDTILAAPEGKVLETAFSTGDGYLIVQIVKTNPATTKPLEDVRNDIVALLQKEKASQLALDAAIAARATITGTVPADLEKRTLTTKGMNRDGVSPGFTTANKDMANAVFGTSSNDWLPTAYTTDDGAALVRVKEVVPASEELWKDMEARMVASLDEAKREQLFVGFLNNLREAASIEILNFDILESIQL